LAENRETEHQTERTGTKQDGNQNGTRNAFITSFIPKGIPFQGTTVLAIHLPMKSQKEKRKDI
jgi:hypothetical protein